MSGGTDMLLQMVVKAKDEASGVLRSIGQHAKESLSGVKEAMGAAGLAADAVIGMSVKAAADYQTMTTQVRNNTTMNQADFDAMNKTIQDLASTTPTSLDALAQGYMKITNFGFSAADAQKILSAANMSAVSTGGDAAQTANVLAAAIHEFNLPAGQAANAMDVMHLAAAEGNMTLEQLVESGGQAYAMAANMGVSFTDVSAAMSAMTRHGFDAATAGTQVKDMIAHIANPAAATRKELERLSKATGIDLVGDFSQAGLKAKGLSGVLADVQKATAGNSAEILKLIPNMRGGLGAMTLTGTGAKDYAEILGSLNDAMAGKVTPSADAFKLSQQTLGFQMGTLKNQAQLLLITIGQEFLPVLTKLLQQVQPIVQQIVDWTKAHPQLVAQILTVVGVVGTFAGGLAMLGTALGVAEFALGPIVGILGSFLLPLVAIVAAVVALAMAWSNNWGDIQGKTKAAWADIQPVLQALQEFGVRVWGAIQDAVSRAWSYIKPDIEAAMAVIQTFATQRLPEAKAAAQNVFNAISFALGKLHDVWNMMWSGISTILQGVWQTIKGIVEIAWAVISGIIKVGLDVLTGNWGQAWQDIQDTLKAVWKGIVDEVHGEIEIVVGVFQTMAGEALGIIHAFAPDFADAAKNLIDGFAEGLLAKVGEVADAAKNIGSTLINGVKGILGIASPSRRLHEIGTQTMAGLTAGIASGTPATTAAMKHAASAMKKEAHAATVAMHKDVLAQIKEMRQDTKEQTAAMMLDTQKKIAEMKVEAVGATAAMKDQIKQQIAALRDQTKEQVAALRDNTTNQIEQMRAQAGLKLTKMATDGVATTKQMSQQAQQQLRQMQTGGVDSATALSADTVAQMDTMRGQAEQVMIHFRDDLLTIYSVLRDDARAAGLAIGDGLRQGIVDRINEIRDAAISAAKAAISAAKAALGVHSPSAVFAEIGQNVGHGFIAGVRQMTGQAQAAMRQMVAPAGASLGAAAGGALAATTPLSASAAGMVGGALVVNVYGNTFTNIASANDIPRRVADELADAISSRLGSRLRGQGQQAVSTATPR